jgi:hypothetical protein
MKKSRIILIIVLAVVAVILKTQTNLWRTEIKYLWGDRIETPYVLFREHGTGIQYLPDGSKSSETPYVKGKKHGTEIEYHEDGSKKLELLYEHGKKISEKRF